MPAILLYAAASLFYAILAFHFWRTRWRGASAPRLARLERAAILAPFALHTWLVYDMLWAQSELHFGFGQALSVMLWLAVLIYWIESRFLELEGMQAPILALAAVCAPLPALFPGLRVRRTRIRPNSGCTSRSRWSPTACSRSRRCTRF